MQYSGSTVYDQAMPQTPSIAVLDDYQGIAREYADWSALERRAQLTVFTDHCADPDALVERLAPFDVVCVMRERTPFPEEVLRRLDKLRLLVTTGMANAAIDMPAARRLGITVCGTPGLASHTAELTWALILALLRHIPAEAAAVRSGEWQHTVGGDLNGRTLGVLGLGKQGSQVARVGQAFGMRVLAWSANLDDARAAEHGAHRVELDELLAEADIATIHLRLSERTEGLIGPRELGLLGSRGLLINTSRGPIVQEEALLAALHDGTIAGAGLDVYDVEPLPPDHPLRSAPRAVLTPHIGYVTGENYRTFYTGTVDSIQAFLAGDPVRVLN
jgi:phosphoglycerate dehydrogenase-like enzyme